MATVTHQFIVSIDPIGSGTSCIGSNCIGEEIRVEIAVGLEVLFKNGKWREITLRGTMHGIGMIELFVSW